MHRSRTSAFGVRVSALLPLLAFACNALTGVGELGVQDATGTTGAGDASLDAVASDGRASDTGTPPDGDGSVVVTDDAGIDASTDADAAPLGFCAALSPAVTLCSDFDGNTILPWTATTSGSATVLTSTAQARSTPRSLHVTNPSGSTGRAFVARTFGGAAPSSITLALSVRADAVVANSTQELAVIFLGTSGGNAYQLQLEVESSGALVIEEETPLGDGTVPERNVPLGITVPLGQWRRITWTVSIGATTSTTSVAVEGVATPASFAVSAHQYKAAPTINLGHDGTVATPFSVFYDDVVVDLK